MCLCYVHVQLYCEHTNKLSVANAVRNGFVSALPYLYAAHDSTNNRINRCFQGINSSTGGPATSAMHLRHFAFYRDYPIEKCEQTFSSMHLEIFMVAGRRWQQQPRRRKRVYVYRHAQIVSQWGSVTEHVFTRW